MNQEDSSSDIEFVETVHPLEMNTSSYVPVSLSEPIDHAMNSSTFQSFSSASIIEDFYQEPDSLFSLEKNPVPKASNCLSNDSSLVFIDNQIKQLPSTLIETFSSFAQTVLPQSIHSAIPILTEYFKSVTISPFVNSILPSLENELRVTLIAKEPEYTFIKLARLLTLSCCSESSCERIFSKARLICGSNKYRSSVKTLNARLLVSYYSHKKFPK